MIEDADKDGTGTLDIIEFLQMMREKVKEQNKEDEIKEAFTVFDVVSFPHMNTFKNGYLGWKWIHRQARTGPNDAVHRRTCQSRGDRCK